MQNATFDPGLTERYSGSLRRAINKDGTFNVHRRGTSWRDLHLYLQLVSMPWPHFWISITAAYLLVNTLFACVYYLLGPHQLQSTDASGSISRFLTAFFFSAHTLTTVGYGSISPVGIAANFVALVEAMVGLLAFAVGTGLLFGRVSRPSARFGFSTSMAEAPYQGISSLQFRLVNRRPNALMELEAKMMLMTVEGSGADRKRAFKLLKLEREQVQFLPLTWTVVHPIDEESPFYGKKAEDLEHLQAEVLVLVKAYDETFGHTVHARYSYTHSEISWNSHFVPAFYFDESGDMVVDIDRVGELEPVMPQGSR